MHKFSFKDFNTQRQVTLEGTAVECLVREGSSPLVEAWLEKQGDQACLFVKGEDDPMSLSLIVDHIFSLNPELQILRVKGTSRVKGLEEFLSEKDYILPRSNFYQIPSLWHWKSKYEIPTETWIESSKVSHPQRPKYKEGLWYQKHFSALQKTLSFRTLQIEKDLDRFYEWHHQPRVYDLWELNQSKADLKVYLEKVQADPHHAPLIFEVDGEPVGYFEVYWAREDRIGAYYENEPFDRGFHFLIGEPQHLGLANTDAALKAITHCLFLDESRTRKIVAEPRSNNQRVLKYVERIPGWTFVREFDFPHKRAALLWVKREDFFLRGGP